jgi:hypothetical protein
LEALRKSRNQNKTIDKGTVIKTRTLLDEARARKEQLSEELKNWLVSEVAKELVEFENAVNLNPNPYSIPGAVAGTINGVGRH